MESSRRQFTEGEAFIGYWDGLSTMLWSYGSESSSDWVSVLIKTSCTSRTSGGPLHPNQHHSGNRLHPRNSQKFSIGRRVHLNKVTASRMRFLLMPYEYAGSYNGTSKIARYAQRPASHRYFSVIYNRKFLSFFSNCPLLCHNECRQLRDF